MRLTIASRRLSVGVSLVAVLAATTACQPFGDLGLPTWPDNPNWQSLVAGPASDDVKPVGIVRTHGNVTNAGALTGSSSGSTVLTVAPGGPPAIVVLDYGHEVGGTPYLNVCGPRRPALNNVRVSTSEALAFLTTNATTTLARAAAAGDTNVKVTSVAPFYVGSPITWHRHSARPATSPLSVRPPPPTRRWSCPPRPATPTSASPASPATPSASPLRRSDAETPPSRRSAPLPVRRRPWSIPAAAGATNVKVASVAGFAAGQRFVLDAARDERGPHRQRGRHGRDHLEALQRRGSRVTPTSSSPASPA